MHRYFAVIGLLLLACSGNEMTSYEVSHALVWKVDRALYEVYSQEQLQRAEEIWCNGTEGRYCPVFEPVMPGEEANVRRASTGFCEGGTGCYRHLVIYVESTELKRCIGAALAHELGHAIGLKFPRDGAEDPDWPVHSSDGMDLMALHNHKDTHICEKGFEVQGATLQAFNDRYGEDETMGASQ